MSDLVFIRGDTAEIDIFVTSRTIQDVIIEGVPTGGAIRLTFNEEETPDIPYNATSTQMRVALETLQGVSPGDFTVAGGPGPTTLWTLTNNTLYPHEITVTGNTLTGGSGARAYVSGRPFNLNGCILRWTMKVSYNQPDSQAMVQHSWTHGGASSGISVANPLNGVAVNTITSAESEDFVPGQLYLYDCQLTDSSGKTKTIIRGNIIVLPDVTITVP
jgi:hypothetical protein